MSDLMLLGVLRMPLPDDPTELDPLTWLQLRDRVRQAADVLESAERLGFLRGLEAAAKVTEGQAIMTDDQGLIQLGDVEFIAQCIRSLAATQPQQGGSDG